jgi:hypothetical protein
MIVYNRSRHLTAHFPTLGPDQPIFVSLTFRKSDTLCTGEVDLHDASLSSSSHGSPERMDGEVILVSAGGRPLASVTFKCQLTISRAAVRDARPASARAAPPVPSSPIYSAVQAEVRGLAQTLSRMIAKQSRVARPNERLFVEPGALAAAAAAEPAPPIDTPPKKRRKAVPLIPRVGMPENYRPPPKKEPSVFPDYYEMRKTKPKPKPKRRTPPSDDEPPRPLEDTDSARKTVTFEVDEPPPPPAPAPPPEKPKVVMDQDVEDLLADLEDEGSSPPKPAKKAEPPPKDNASESLSSPSILSVSSVDGDSSAG